MNKEQFKILRQEVEAWNAWRDEHPDIRPDLVGAYLNGANLVGANLVGANLVGADLSRADLSRANLVGANLFEANLVGAYLNGTNLVGTHLSRADLSRAALVGANLSRADLSRAALVGANLFEADLVGTDLSRADLFKAGLFKADLFKADLHDTIFADLDLSGCRGLESCVHHGPSIIDHRTLQRSGPLPLVFLRGVGLPDKLIDYLPSILEQAIQMYSCFISYSSKDQAFAERLHADLQNRGVRCWFAPHDMPIGAKILDAIDEAIRLRDKVLLALSDGAIASGWVEDEVTRTLDEERERKQLVLFPIRLDDAVMETKEAWARLLRGQRNIGDFTRWKEHDAYQQALDRLLRDLRVEQA